MSPTNTALFNTRSVSCKAASVSSSHAEQTPAPIVPTVNACVYIPDCSSIGCISTLGPLSSSPTVTGAAGDCESSDSVLNAELTRFVGVVSCTGVNIAVNTGGGTANPLEGS